MRLTALWAWFACRSEKLRLRRFISCCFVSEVRQPFTLFDRQGMGESPLPNLKKSLDFVKEGV